MQNITRREKRKLRERRGGEKEEEMYKGEGRKNE